MLQVLFLIFFSCYQKARDNLALRIYHKVTISGGMGTEDGMTVARDEYLPLVVVGAKLTKLIAVAGKDFM